MKKLISFIVLFGFIFIQNCEIYALRTPAGIPADLPPISCKTIINKWIAKSSIHSTLSTILDSLGNFKENAVITKLVIEKLPKENQAGYIPFHLNNGGQNFFADLFDLNSVDQQSYILTFETTSKENKKLLERFKILPYGLLVTDSATKKVYFFDLTTFLLNDTDTSTINSMNKQSVDLYKSAAKQLFPNFFTKNPLALITINTPEKPEKIRKKLIKEFNFTGSFTMLTIGIWGAPDFSVEEFNIEAFKNALKKGRDIDEMLLQS